MDLLPDVWRQELWLPPGVTWGHMERLAHSERPLPQDLLVALPLSLGFVALRFLFERLASASFTLCINISSAMTAPQAVPLTLGQWASLFLFPFSFWPSGLSSPPMGRCLGVRNRTQARAAPSPEMESFYTQRSRHPTQSEIATLMTLCGKTQRQIETWFRCRRNQDRPCQTKRFGEAR
ncbi:unnamed protein product [Tetraodon nigroviridis]|uniref:(spotted green pufferfish) hypothetical protein n=1 Tax=Tetraodon nigroviridis TaxID=99883 RepID=Q4SBK7_TETNG|nr:unnamed protein product [Tetraodon nigroviridis]